MKINFSKFLVPFLALGALFTSCSSETAELKELETTASLNVALTGNGLSLSRATAKVSLDEENAVNKMMVLVFSDGVLEAKQEIKGKEGKVTGLITGPKQVSVVVNPSEDLDAKLKKVIKFADFKTVTLDLEEEWNDKGEMNAKKGFTMTGQAAITLKPGTDNKVEIPVSRVVAKVILGQVDVKLLEGFDEDKFKLTGVSMMKVRSKSLLGFPDHLLKTTGHHFQYMGGMDGKVSTVKEERLAGEVNKGENNTYFYVTPNDNADNNCTLMTISATYDGEPQHFAFRINDKEIKGSEELTGKYIEANHQYTLNVLIKKPFGSDPEDPKDPATLEVTVVPQDWVVVPTQVVEW